MTADEIRGLINANGLIYERQRDNAKVIVDGFENAVATLELAAQLAEVKEVLIGMYRNTSQQS